MKNFIEVLNSSNERRLININSILYVRESGDGKAVIVLHPLAGGNKTIITANISLNEVIKLIEDAQG